jgi:hypothetical protein
MSTTLLLPERPGPRPATWPMTPHEQLDQIAPVTLQRELWRRMAALDGVTVGRSGISIPATKALHLARGKATGPAAAFLTGTEFAHLHGEHDGSLHVALPIADAAAAVDKGWAEYHPLARNGVMPRSLVMIYGPREESELETVWQLVELSYAFACGQLD